MDYRTISGQFDRIVSVGMFEHVGAADYTTYSRTASRVLADDGVMLLHSIGRLDGASATNPWIAKHVFPGGHIPALSEVLPEIEKSGLIVTDIEILRLHYAETLAAWSKRFLERREEAVSLFGEEFCRLWEFYLAASVPSLTQDSHGRANQASCWDANRACRHIEAAVRTGAPAG